MIILFNHKNDFQSKIGGAGSAFSFLKKLFLGRFEVHSRIEQNRQRFRLYSLPPHMHSLPHLVLFLKIFLVVLFPLPFSPFIPSPLPTMLLFSNKGLIVHDTEPRMPELKGFYIRGAEQQQ